MEPESSDNDSEQAANEEPVFVLRARDKLAPIVVRVWAELAAAHGCPEEKLRAAFHTQLEMRDWALRHGAKWPD